LRGLTFELVRTEVGILATADPDVFADCGGSAAEIRAVIKVVVNFCALGQGEPAPFK
jgi:hypothetical protein